MDAYLCGMSATEIIQELPKLTGAERQEVLNRLVELLHIDLGFAACPRTRAEEPAQPDRLEEAWSSHRVVELRTRGIGATQAGDLRARLRTFAEDWDRPEASIYDENPAR